MVAAVFRAPCKVFLYDHHEAKHHPRVGVQGLGHRHRVAVVEIVNGRSEPEERAHVQSRPGNPHLPLVKLNRWTKSLGLGHHADPLLNPKNPKPAENDHFTGVSLNVVPGAVFGSFAAGNMLAATSVSEVTHRHYKHVHHLGISKNRGP